MRSSAYTCRRCCNSLVSLGQRQVPGVTRSRWISNRSTADRTASLEPAIRPTSLPNQRRTVSSLGTQSEQGAGDGPYITSLGHASPSSDRVLLKPDNLFHSFSNSPSPPIRRRAAFMKQHAYCPHPSHQPTREPTAPGDPEGRKPAGDAIATALPPAHVRFECPDCGIPVSCCEEHWADDYESHLEICDTLKTINEDDHDLRSGRFFPEFDYPGPQRAEEFVLNMSNWDTFLYTRDFKAIDQPRSMRQVTRLLTYPTTIASVLHELSPYNIKKGGRLTPEGLRSMSGMSLCPCLALHNPMTDWLSSSLLAPSAS